MHVDINADLGESFGRYKLGNDDEVMHYITSANIACGWHAGDPVVMRHTVKLAKNRKIKIGAHPGYPDLMGFGRRFLNITPEEASDYVLYQIGALEGFVRSEGLRIQHVKPHGALYNAMIKDEKLARGVLEAIADFDKNLIFVGLSMSKPVKMAEEMGLRVANEVFADRAYNSDGTLVSRKLKGAVISDKEVIGERVLSMVKDGGIKSVDGNWVDLKVDTICVHGDNPGAVDIAKYIRRILEKEGIIVKSMGDFIG